MTPQDHVEAVWDEIHSIDICDNGFGDAAKVRLADEFAKAIAAQRERDALIVESDEAGHFSTDHLVRKALAKKIREGK